MRAILLAIVMAVVITGAVVAAGSIPNGGAHHAAPESTPTASATPGLHVPAGSSVLVIGDSYALGVGASGQDKRWASLLSESERWDTTVDAVGGTGFVWGGGPDGDARQDYASRIALLARTQTLRPDLVILEGGQNDIKANDEQLTRAVTLTVRMVNAAWPAAEVVVLGPAAPEPLASQLDRLNTSVERGALLAGAYSINPRRTEWFTSENSPRTNYEGSHVNDKGHALIATKTEQAFRRFADGAHRF